MYTIMYIGYCLRHFNVMYCGLSALRPIRAIRAIIDRGEVTYEGVHYIIIIYSYDYS